MNTERHPLQPFLPKKGRILMLGSFPPKKEKWSMDFFYPNWINDMWRIMGHIFYNDKEYFIAEENGKKTKRFDKEKCIGFAKTAGIAMFDTAREVRRLKDNASDKFLEIVTPTDIEELLKQIEECRAIVTTGQKATDVICSTFGCTEPSVGSFSEVVIGGKTIRLWRMPSSSRAYPLAMEKKAEYYRKMYEYEKLI
jgi:G:T/U-mismatch repair DNA glycosylase